MAAFLSLPANADHWHHGPGYSAGPYISFGYGYGGNPYWNNWAGGIRNYAEAVQMLQAGASRLGTSSGIKILEEAAAR